MKNAIRLMSLLLTMLLLLPLAAPALAEGTDENATHAELISKYSKLDLAPYAGKVIYLNFFTEWCPYCMEEMPDIKKAFETYSPEDLQVILVHVWDGEDLSNSESIRKTYGLEEMTFFEDEDRKLSALVSLPAYPLSLFIDQEGKISTGTSGGLSYADMEKILDDLGVRRKDAVTP